MDLELREIFFADNEDIATKKQAELDSMISNQMEKFDNMEKPSSDLKIQNQTTIEDSMAYEFRIFRGHLLMHLIKKLCPKEAKKARYRPTSTKWSTMAENYAEADFIKATKKFNVCKNSAQMMKIFQSFGTVSLSENPEPLS